MTAPQYSFPQQTQDEPERIGKYLVLRKLGVGGMAEVFLGKGTNPAVVGGYVALKRILPQHAGDPEYRKLFEYEAKLSSHLSHVNIVQVYDFIIAEKSYTLVMEFVAGKNLSQLIARLAQVNLRLPTELAVLIAVDVCNALDHAHTRIDVTTGQPLQVVHRDIAPKNILISYEGVAKILDFGIAETSGGHATDPGNIKGTADYFAPEMLDGGPVDHRSDLFSLGLVLYELISGESLFRGENIFQTIKSVQACDLPAKKIAALDVPEELKQILTKALQKDPKDRYQHAALFHGALSGYMKRNHPEVSAFQLGDAIMSLFENDLNAEREEMSNSMAFKKKDDRLELEMAPLKKPRTPTTYTPSSLIVVPTPEPKRSAAGWLILILTLLLVASIGGIIWLSEPQTMLKSFLATPGSGASSTQSPK